VHGRLQQDLACRHGAVGQRVFDLGPHLGLPRGGLLLGNADQLLTPLPEIAYFRGEGLEALAALGLGQHVGLEGREIALDRVFALGDLRVDNDRVQFVRLPIQDVNPNWRSEVSRYCDAMKS
jgi:hypothetical protein